MDSHRNNPLKLICVVGARPNFMKIAPIMQALKKIGSDIDVSLLHTGQHYDVAMNEQYFQALGIPHPDINLEVGSGSHAEQTAEVMCRFEKVLNDKKPDAILVVGDVNSTIACALVASKKNIVVIHVEAGLRSFDRAMPEEINRVLTDQISDLLFTTEPSGKENLLREGIAEERIYFVGNVMIDTLRMNLSRAVAAPDIAAAAGSADFPTMSGAYGVVTMHRPSNVDNRIVLKSMVEVLQTVSKDLPLIFPVHPRTKAMLQQFGFDAMLENKRILLLPPMGYLEMLGLMRDAKVVLTDSGGVQEETTALGVPCLTLRENTERPITVEQGSNTVVGQRPDQILSAFYEVMQTGGKAGRIPLYWDGHAAERIAATLVKHFHIASDAFAAH